MGNPLASGRVRAYAREMRKIGAVAATLVIAASLSGCGALPVAPAPATSTPASEGDSTSTQDAIAQETAYFTALRQQLTTTDFSTPKLWIDLGHAVCKAYDSGLTPKEVFDSMKGGALTEPEASAVVVISGIHLCPEYAPRP